MENSSKDLTKTLLSFDSMSYCLNNATNEKEKEEYWESCAVQLATSIVVPMVIHSIAKLGVFEIISKAQEMDGRDHLSAHEIASRLEFPEMENHLMKEKVETAASMLNRMLSLLVSHSVLTYTCADVEDSGNSMRMYGLSPIAKYFVPNSEGASLVPFITLNADKVFLDCWPKLTPAVLEGGIPFDRVHGMHAFDYCLKDPRFNEVFNKAMINQTGIVIGRILETYKGFDQIKQVVDVGGGLGITLKTITSVYPHIEGINFDLPHVIQRALNYPGIQHVAGDMFEKVPAGEAIFMKWILHDWNDHDCIKLLKNCHESLPGKGKVIVVEGILPEVPDTAPASQFMYQLDMAMLTQIPGGKERTRQEFIFLATSAGFAGVRFDCFVCNFWVMEFYK